MQVILNIPDVIPQDIVNRILKQVENKLRAEERRAKNLILTLPKSNDVTIKARQNLTKMVNQLRDSAEELGVVSEEEISAWVNEARVKNARHY